MAAAVATRRWSAYRYPIEEAARNQKDLEARAKVAAALAAIFALLAGAGFSGVLPPTVSVVAGCVALAGLVAAFQYTVEARRAGLAAAAAEAERERTEWSRRVLVTDVDEVDPTRIGVDRAAQEILPGADVPQYVERAVDHLLRAAIAGAFEGTAPWLVVVEGPSKAGKSRSLFEAVRYCARGRQVRLIAPSDGAALRDLVDRGDDTKSTAAVLWLDDLEPLINDGVTLATLRSWQADVPGRIVVATYGGKGSEHLADRSEDGLTTLAAKILDHAHEIAFAPTTADELNPIRSALSEAQLAAVVRHGLAAYLVAAPALARKLSTRRHAIGDPECPEGVAIVYMAVDWARCGRTDPITEALMRNLWSSYLPSDVRATDENLSGALRWALRPVAGSIALLHDAGSYLAFDWVVQFLSERGTQPPDAMWAAAVQSAEDAQALSVADAAWENDRLLDAEQAFRRARASHLDAVASLAGNNLGIVLGRLGRSEEELDVYGEVVRRFGEATEPVLREQVARALMNKGIALRARKRSQEELDVYDEVVRRFGEATEPALREQVAEALVHKSLALMHLERSQEALDVYEEFVRRFADAQEPSIRGALSIVRHARSEID